MSKKKELLFLPLGGCDEIGMNLNLYGYEDSWIMVDLGITFIDELGMDVAMPDIEYVTTHIAPNLLGLVVTHGHEDHIGAIPYLWDRLRCPIYTTPFTAFLIREKLKEAGLLHEAKIIEVPVEKILNLDPFQIEYVSITHSIPESHVLKITTPTGVIVHTGDWKLDSNPLVGIKTDEQRLKAIGDEGVLALVCDSTNVFEQGHSGSEQEVRHNLQSLISEQTGRVIVACFASNVARLETCAYTAEITNRNLVIVGRSLERMDKAARYAGYLGDYPPFPTDRGKVDLSREDVLMICTGSQGEERSALYRIAQNTHPTVRIRPGDVIIFSSRMIPGNEKRIMDMQDKLMNLGAIVITDDDDLTHVSGHPNRDELKKMYSWIRPEVLIPVHGDKPHIREHAAFGLECGIPHTLRPGNGDVMRLSPGEPAVIAKVPHGRLGLDGDEIVPLSSKALRRRHQLGAVGAIFVTIPDYSEQRKRSKDIRLSMVGVCSEEEQPTLQEALFEEVHRLLDQYDREEEFSTIVLQITKRLERLCQDWRGKKPVVIVH